MHKLKLGHSNSWIELKERASWTSLYVANPVPCSTPLLWLITTQMINPRECSMIHHKWLEINHFLQIFQARGIGNLQSADQRVRWGLHSSNCPHSGKHPASYAFTDLQLFPTQITKHIPLSQAAPVIHEILQNLAFLSWKLVRHHPQE